jgi:alpha-tubulin suppressor-like RCC1 family protein
MLSFPALGVGLIQGKSTKTPTPTPVYSTLYYTGDYVGPSISTPNSWTVLTGKWSDYATGWFNNVFLLSGQKLYGYGDNSHGNLGIGNINNVYSGFENKQLIAGNWDKIAVGYGHAMALSGKKLFATGRNAYGQLGLGDSGATQNDVSKDRSSFTAVTGDWDKVVCGWFHTFALSGKKLFGTGINGSPSILGIGNTLSGVNQFTPITGSWDDIVTCLSHSFALSSGTSKWFACGDGSFGQFGLPTTTTYNTFTEIPGNYTKILAGGSFTLALSGKKLFVAGNNGAGQMGLGLNDATNVYPFSSIPGDYDDIGIGNAVSFALSGNRIWACGDNNTGNLGLGLPAGYVNVWTVSPVALSAFKLKSQSFGSVVSIY